MNKFMSLATAVALLVVGCGSSNNNNSSKTMPTTVPTTIPSAVPTNPIDMPTAIPTAIPSPALTTDLMGIGYYVDSAVDGVDYKCGDKSGKTNNAGMFEFTRGEDCKFSVGKYKLRDVNSLVLDDNIFILEDNLTIARLLQTMDKDGNASNGIQLLEDTAEILEDIHIDGVPTEDALLDTIRENLYAKHQDDYKGRVVSKEEAKEHIEKTKAVLDNNGHRTQYSIDMNSNDGDNIQDNIENNLTVFGSDNNITKNIPFGM